MTARDLVVQTLRAPASVRTLSPAQWDLLLRQARRADLLARLAWLLRRDGLVDAAPAPAQALLRAAEILNTAQLLEVQRELTHLQTALAPLRLQPVLLKGAAYLAADAPCIPGRSFNDIDLLVPKDRIGEVEAHLMMGGWMTTHLDAYDQRYYRQWMHEIPPMMHNDRGSVLDVHHAILPDTAHVQPDSRLLMADATESAMMPAFRVLSPVDMLLHSMTHLLHNDELSHGLRDLSDIDLMLRHQAANAAFWSALATRAEQLGLGRTLHQGLTAAVEVLGTPVPSQALTSARRHAAPVWQDRGLAWLWRQALRGPHASCRTAGAEAAEGLLYVRAHALRMPPGLLLRHLTIKAFKRVWPTPEAH
ncbi:MAG: nucleotidyltransferase family protein [Rubrivivax sp.]|nr:nucleotidyltransferase family protein [Rubrivivax sp.]